jgi:hypothetical protein
VYVAELVIQEHRDAAAEAEAEAAKAEKKEASEGN